MKGLVTAAGKGTRSGLDGKFRKEMLPLYDFRDGKLVLRPVIDIVLTRLFDSRVKEAAVVLQNSDSITETYVRREFPDVQIIYQEKPSGFGNAIYCARDFLSGDSIINAGDAFILDSSYYRDMRRSEESNLFLFNVKDASRYGNARIDSSTGMILEAKEKPRIPISNLALCAVYRFTFPISRYLHENDTEFTVAIQRAIESGEKIFHRNVPSDLWVSVGKVETYVEKVNMTFQYNQKI